MYEGVDSIQKTQDRAFWPWYNFNFHESGDR